MSDHEDSTSNSELDHDMVDIANDALNTATTITPKAPRKKRVVGRPVVSVLEEHKELIVRLFDQEDAPLSDIARRLNLEHGLDISERTISRRISIWGIPRKKARGPVTQEFKNRIIYHYNNNLNDEQICQALALEGHEIKPRPLARLRQKLGLRRRSRFPEFREFSDEEDPSHLGIEPDVLLARPRPASDNKKKRPAEKPAKFSTSLIPRVSGFVEKYMSNYDGSHDFNHIKRVVGLAHLIYNESKEEVLMYGIELDLHIITLAALMHDVGDKKYLEPGQDGSTLVLATLLSFGAPEALALKVQRIVLGVSYSSEIANPAQVQEAIMKYPELAIVQDADRLDAIGAIGIGRTFTFGGAKGAKNMGETIAHFDDKLLKLENMMKTTPGRRLARVRAERLQIFKSCWEEEQAEAEGSIRRS